MSSKYTIELLEPLVQTSTSNTEVARKLGLKTGCGSVGYLSKVIKSLGLDTEHFRRHIPLPKYGGQNRRTARQILILRSSDSHRQKNYALKRALLEIGRIYECEECKIGNSYNGKPLTLAVDHKNGITYDDREENLRFICPNCHTQTPNYGSKQFAKPKTQCSECSKVIDQRSKTGKCRSCYLEV